jgi:uncharacterized protein with PIN domain
LFELQKERNSIMKILQLCQPKGWWAGKVTRCGNCNSILQFEKDDIVTIEKGNDHRANLRAIQKCPTCKYSVWVFASSPDSLKEFQARDL